MLEGSSRLGFRLGMGGGSPSPIYPSVLLQLQPGLAGPLRLTELPCQGSRVCLSPGPWERLTW